MRAAVLGLLVLTFTVGAEAEAKSPAKFDRLVSKGLARYRAEDYSSAAELFQKAYALKASPELIYNIARCHERLLETDEAIAGYERFLELSGTPAKLRARAREAITTLRAEQVREEPPLEPKRIEAEPVEAEPEPPPKLEL